MLFTFARSGHTNYMSYTLEMICDLEYESSPELKEVSLLSLVVNLTGEEGGFVAGDIYQEGLNQGIEPIVQKKDANFGAYHIQHLWSCNIKDIQDLWSTFWRGVGLSKRSGCHKDPHEKPELKTLLHEYKKAELHVCQPGRAINGKRTDGENVAKGRDVDNMQKGIWVLVNSGLKKWIGKMTRAQGLREDTSNSALESGPNHGDSNNTQIDDNMWLGRDRDEDTTVPEALFQHLKKSQTCFPYCTPKYKEFAMRTSGIESY
jgi:hypothetical protein